jgi:hypothetical protein
VEELEKQKGRKKSGETGGRGEKKGLMENLDGKE